MAVDPNSIPDSASVSALKSAPGIVLGALVAFFAAGCATLARGILRAPRGYETADGFFVGEIPVPAQVSRPMAGKDYDALVSGIDRLLEIFREPATELSDEDELLRTQLVDARARSLRVKSALALAPMVGA